MPASCMQGMANSDAGINTLIRPSVGPQPSISGRKGGEGGDEACRLKLRAGGG